MPYFQINPFAKLKKFCRMYYRTLVDVVIQALLLVVCTAILELLILYSYCGLWHVYRLTYIGRRFVDLNPKLTQTISAVLSGNLVDLSIHTTLAALMICMAAGAFCQVFHISRHFYHCRGWIGKFAMWGLPLAAMVSVYINAQYQFNLWAAVIPVAIIPTLCVFTYGFNFSERLLPEIGQVVRAILLFFRGIITLTGGLLRLKISPPF